MAGGIGTQKRSYPAGGATSRACFAISFLGARQKYVPKVIPGLVMTFAWSFWSSFK
jgi:hypothetical protein